MHSPGTRATIWNPGRIVTQAKTNSNKCAQLLNGHFIVFLGMIKHENSDTFTGVFNHGVLNREGKLLYISQSHTTAEGIWKDGLMDGEMNITTNVRNQSIVT